MYGLQVCGAAGGAAHDRSCHFRRAMSAAVAAVASPMLARPRVRAVVIVNAGAGSGCPPEWLVAAARKFAAAGLRADLQLAHDGAEIQAAARAAVAAGAARRGRRRRRRHGQRRRRRAGRTPASRSACCRWARSTTSPRTCGMPLELDDAAVAAIADGRCRAVDVGEVNGRLFINNSSLGLYPDIVRDRERSSGGSAAASGGAARAPLARARRYPVPRRRRSTSTARTLRAAHAVRLRRQQRVHDGRLRDRRARAPRPRRAVSLYVAQRTGRFGAAAARLARPRCGGCSQARDFDAVAGAPRSSSRAATAACASRPTARSTLMDTAAPLPRPARRACASSSPAPTAA